MFSPDQTAQQVFNFLSTGFGKQETRKRMLAQGHDAEIVDQASKYFLNRKLWTNLGSLVLGLLLFVGPPLLMMETEIFSIRMLIFWALGIVLAIKGGIGLFYYVKTLAS